jgi:hypothetical protein
VSGAVIMGASRGETGKASDAGDVGNAGTGGVVCAIRLDGADASVFCRRMGHVGGLRERYNYVLSVHELRLASYPRMHSSSAEPKTSGSKLLSTPPCAG